MKLIVRDTDTLAALLVARNTINDILARRTEHGDASYQQKIITGTPQPLGPALSDSSEMANQPSPLPAAQSAPTAAPSPAPTQAAAAPEPEKRGRGRPRKETPVAKTYSLDEIRKKMIELSASGGQPMMDAQRALIHSMEVNKISELPVDRYAEFMDKLVALESAS